MLFTFSAIFLDVLLLDIVFFFYRLSYFYKKLGDVREGGGGEEVCFCCGREGPEDKHVSTSPVK